MGRASPLVAGVPTATRLRIDAGVIRFTDGIQGTFRQNVAATFGDTVLRRRDGLFAYVLAVVVDDAEQRITHVVRGADLLDDTPRQMYLQRALDLPTPQYAHVPVLTESGGRKLAKSSRSVRLAAQTALPQLLAVFELLNLAPPPDMASTTIPDAWAWAFSRWRRARVPRRLALALQP